MQHFIDGKFISGGKDFFESINPSTLEKLQVPLGGEEEIGIAAKAATAAFKTWSKTSKQYRHSILTKIADLIESRLEKFAEAESQDQGKPLALARKVDIPRAIHNFRYFANAILLEQSQFSDVLEGFHSYVIQEPAGVAALISPWNLPLYLLTWKIAPCLAYGCTAVCKPSEFTSLTAYMLCQVFQEAGLPDGVCNMVFGVGPTAGNALIHHPDIPLISFTGGTVTGKIVYQAAAKLNKKVSLELGGKNANLIFADCDYEDALNTTIRSSFTNQGEICLCGSRIFVEREIYDRFVSDFVAKTQAMTVGDPKDDKTQIGALVSLQHMEKVLNYVDIAKQEGGTVLCGGNRITTEALKNGFFVEPTVITNVHPTNSRVQQEEIFGPVVSICPFDTEEDALNFANSTQYGLSATVWTESLRRANRISRGLQVGTVWINTWMTRDLNVPFGGVKMSGIGREGGYDSLHFYCEAKTVCIKH